MKIILEIEDIQKFFNRFTELGGFKHENSVLISKGIPNDEAIDWLLEECTTFNFKIMDNYSIFSSVAVDSISNESILENINFLKEMGYDSLVVVNEIIHPLEF